MTIQQQIDNVVLTLQRRQQQIIVFTMTGIVLLAGYYLYQQHKEQHIKNASLVYYKNIIAKEQTDYEQLKALSELTTTYKKTIYAQLAHAKLAKLAADKNDYHRAINEYNSALRSTEDVNIKALFQMRLAKIYVLAKKPTKALATVSQITLPEYSLIKNIISIDAYIQLQETEKAKALANETIVHCKKEKSTENTIVQELIHERLEQIKKNEK